MTISSPRNLSSKLRSFSRLFSDSILLAAFGLLSSNLQETHQKTKRLASQSLALKSFTQCACCCVLLPELMSGHLVSTEQTDGGQKSIVRLTLGLLPWSRLHQHCDHLKTHTHTHTHRNTLDLSLHCNWNRRYKSHRQAGKCCTCRAAVISQKPSSTPLGIQNVCICLCFVCIRDGHDSYLLGPLLEDEL